MTGLFGCSKAEPQDDTPNTTETALTEYTPAQNRKVIIDTDTGADDASALISQRLVRGFSRFFPLR